MLHSIGHVYWAKARKELGKKRAFGGLDGWVENKGPRAYEMRPQIGSAKGALSAIKEFYYFELN